MKKKEYQAPHCRIILMPATMPLMTSEIQPTSTGFVAGFDDDDDIDLDAE